MRVAVLNLTGGGFSGGYKRYISSTLPLLALSPEITEILCASPSSLGVEAWLSGTPKIKFTSCEPFRFLRHAPDVGLLAALDEFNPDLIFVPLERHVKYRNVPVVTVIHNMGPLSGIKVSSGLLEKAKCLAQSLETKIAVKHSAAVIAPTDHVRDSLIQKWGVSHSKITTINFGSSTMPKESHPPTGLNPSERFIFTAGAIEVYRGLEDILKAFPRLRSSFPGLKLLVAGGARLPTLGYFRYIKKLAKRFNIENDVFWLGNLPQEELFWCYKNCAAFVMTSRVESFSFVALEAMQCGCACVSTNSPCLPEVLHDCALYYNPSDISGLTNQLTRVLNFDSVSRARVFEMGIKSAAKYSWEVSAKKTLAIFKSAISMA